MQSATFKNGLFLDSVEIKPVTKRNLRRRPNEPTPISEKRPLKSTPQMQFRLVDAEINDDLAAIGVVVKPSSSSTTATGSNSPARSISNGLFHLPLLMRQLLLTIRAQNSV